MFMILTSVAVISALYFVIPAVTDAAVVDVTAISVVAAIVVVAIVVGTMFTSAYAATTTPKTAIPTATATPKHSDGQPTKHQVSSTAATPLARMKR